MNAPDRNRLRAALSKNYSVAAESQGLEQRPHARSFKSFIDTANALYGKMRQNEARGEPDLLMKRRIDDLLKDLVDVLSHGGGFAWADEEANMEPQDRNVVGEMSETLLKILTIFYFRYDPSKETLLCNVSSEEVN